MSEFPPEDPEDSTSSLLAWVILGILLFIAGISALAYITARLQSFS